MLNEIKIKSIHNDNIRWGISLALGMLVLLWRIILPTNVEITTAIVVLVAVLDLVLIALLIILNKKELKEAFVKRFTRKDILKTVLFFITIIVFMNIYGLITLIPVNGVPLFEMMAESPAPADWVAMEFFAIFPIGVFISAVIAAPIWEEIVFRMAGKNLFRNPVLFVVITSCMFAFIHTVNFSLIDNLFFLMFGVFYAIAYLILKDIRILMIVHFIWNLINALGALLVNL
jgi:membrane protease YdiL (CAAX protease family)